MKTITSTLFLFGLLLGAYATDTPDVRYLKFYELAANFNTVYSKCQMLQCHSAFDVFLPEGKFATEGIDILVPETPNVRGEKLLFLKWNYSDKKWITIKGKKVSSKTINKKKYHLVHVNETGVYGLFNDDRAKGEIKLILAPSLRISRVEFSQENVQVNFEKELFNKPHSIEIPFGAVSILSKISLDVFSSQENKTSAYAFRLGEIPSTHRITSKKNRTVVFITKKDLARISRSSTPLNPTP
ncbi:MAG: hypothetical protein ACEQSL_11605 [Sediminibacterium sp.]